MAKNLYIGLMSGTSLDGVDAALCDFSQPTIRVVETFFLPYPDALKNQLIDLHTPAHHELENAALIGNQLAQLYAEASLSLLKKAGVSADEIAAIGNHGQTIRHRPELGFTLQIGNNALLAERTNITVVGDFRSRDIAAGGQGAPLVPAFHQAVFGNPSKNRVIVNIGGIANITYLGKEGQVFGFDTGPGNMLLDGWTQLKIEQPFDRNGAWASTGVVLDSLLTELMSEPYFALSPPKSTGRDLFNAQWLQDHLLYPHRKPQDVARTLVAFTAQTIANDIQQYCPRADEIYLCGGGAHNCLLINELAQILSTLQVQTTQALGLAVDWVEAACFAWLASMTLANKAANLPAVTGAQGVRVLGAIYPK